MKSACTLTLMAVTAGLVAAPTVGSAGAAPTDPDSGRFFESSIRPLLVRECQSCHGPAVQRGGLRLDSLKALLKGGGRGPALRPGDPAASLLLAALEHRQGAPAMPPNRKLTALQIADLRRWVERGAAWPEASGRKVDAAHWAYQPVSRPQPPPVRNRVWVRNPIDAFILADLERAGLKPAAPADRRTWLRRATFDLTGLPPRVEEVRGFLADQTPEAYERVVERLLASPAYGERWGRHWLDVARYADSNGLDENVHYGNAWRYRDWVIEAFRRDVPYDRFLVEQLAGDLLPADVDRAARQAQLTATGFLAVGPKFISEVDTQKVLMDLVDEQVDTLGRTVMGVTLGCARCHDHKFDPFSQRDYYALAGILKSSKTLDLLKKPRMWWEHSLASPDDEARQAAHQARVDDCKKRMSAAKGEDAKQLKSELAELEKLAPELPGAMGVTEGEIADAKICVRGDHLDLGDSVPRGFPVILSGGRQPALDEKRSGRLELARWLVAPDHPLTTRVIANRIWRWHFGRGLVGSTDNFGALGERPSHPGLLDWLARRFAADGWSFKSMHRLIMLSNTYRMGSGENPVATGTDPENRLRWRWDLRRLEVEEIRDSLLFTSDLLDPGTGGKSLPLKNREYVFDHTSKDATRYDSRRRTIYLPVIRNNLYDVFQLFDFGDGAVPEGNRPTTTVAPQALFVMNSDLVQDAAAALARWTERLHSEAEPRVHGLHERLYGRPATAEEIRRANGLLRKLEATTDPSAASEDRRRQAWTWYCHTLLAANEFVYVR